MKITLKLMTLEQTLRGVNKVGRTLLTALLAATSLSLGSCNKNTVNVPGDIIIDNPNFGVITGKVLMGDIQNNQIVYNGTKACVVIENLEDTREGYMETSPDGRYAMDSLAGGEIHKITASNSCTIFPDWEMFGETRDETSVFVEKQRTSEAEDLLLLRHPFLVGRIYSQDKATPLANREVKLYEFRSYNSQGNASGNLMYSTITTPDGEFGFKRENNVGHQPGRFFITTSAGKLLFFDTNEEKSPSLPLSEPNDLVREDLYLK